MGGAEGGPSPIALAFPKQSTWEAEEEYLHSHACISPSASLGGKNTALFLGLGKRTVLFHTKTASNTLLSFSLIALHLGKESGGSCRFLPGEGEGEMPAVINRMQPPLNISAGKIRP